jgi:hypothetical protein
MASGGNSKSGGKTEVAPTAAARHCQAVRRRLALIVGGDLSNTGQVDKE